MRQLRVSPCQRLCRWQRSVSPDEPWETPTDLFACLSCGSEWTPDQAWTPADADGTVPDAVRRARRGAG